MNNRDKLWDKGLKDLIKLLSKLTDEEAEALLQLPGSLINFKEPRQSKGKAKTAIESELAVATVAEKLQSCGSTEEGTKILGAKSITVKFLKELAKVLELAPSSRLTKKQLIDYIVEEIIEVHDRSRVVRSLGKQG